MLVSSHLVDSQKLINSLRRTSPRTNIAIVRELLLTLALNTQKISTTKTIRRSGGAPIKGRLTNRRGGAGGVGSIGVNQSGLPRFAEVGSDRGYMALHETGDPSARIPSHRVKSHTRSVAFGKKVSPFTVPAHTRSAHTANFPARPWLGPAVKEVVRTGPQLMLKIWERHANAA